MTVKAEEYAPLQLFIDGHWLEAEGRSTSPVLNPATGREIGRLPLARAADLDLALEAAAKGFATWRRTSAYDRAAVLFRAAALLRERADEIGRCTTLEQGKRFVEARAEVLGAADILSWFAEEGRRAYGRIVPSRVEHMRNLVLHEPVGPVAAFSPWNFPITIPARKVGSALAAGCSCIIKPAEETPASGLALARALDDAGLPKGVLNVVFGVPSEVSSHLIASPTIRKVSFTGSTIVGKSIAGLAAVGVKRATLELGGHAPVVVFADADVERAVELAVAAKFRNAGQICNAPTRFYLHEDVHDDFVERFAGTASKLVVGDGSDPSTDMGPLANSRRVEAMERFVADAVDHGAGLVTGGSAPPGEGFFWQPTVLTDVPPEALAMNEEIFGPVVVTSRFASLDEVVEQANRLPYGLAAYAFTTSLGTATAISDALEAGMVGVNHFVLISPETPFGGVKESGYGSEGGSEGLEDNLVTKLVSQV